MLAKPRSFRPNTVKESSLGTYLLRRLLLIIPTLWAIITINFFIVQIAPGGPVDQALANIEFGQATGMPGSGSSALSQGHNTLNIKPADGQYRGSRGLDP